MYMGLDIGTSAVKAVICDEAQIIVAQVDVALEISRPHPLWSEQNPSDWWEAVLQAFGELKRDHAEILSSVQAIGIAGQMHGAVLLGDTGKVLRPAILWNDGRSSAECAEMEAACPDLRQISGNIAMPGFTAPKLLWVKKNEPEVFTKVAKILLPKDYIRYRLTGDYVSEMSDAAGTLWLDVAKRDWSDTLLGLSDLKRTHMPSLVEGNAISGYVRDDIAVEYGLSSHVAVAGGAGDNAGGAVGIGAVEAGRAFLSLGTSGVLFLSNDKYSPNPADGVHAFCHCLPDKWHQMSVILSAASCLEWVTKLTGALNEAELLEEAAKVSADAPLIFLPYLSGERTPHNDPDAKGVFFGLTHDTNRGALARAVIEGVAFAFADGLDALMATSSKIDHVSVIGGGAKSDLWGEILASVLELDLSYHESGEVGPAYGAARLARICIDHVSIEQICSAPAVTNVIKPNADHQEIYTYKKEKYRRLYKALKNEFTA